MAQYLVQCNQTSETWCKLITNPEDRRKALAAQVEKLGGKLLRYWHSCGPYHGVHIADMPDNVSLVSRLPPLAEWLDSQHGGRREERPRDPAPAVQEELVPAWRAD